MKYLTLITLILFIFIFSTCKKENTMPIDNSKSNDDSISSIDDSYYDYKIIITLNSENKIINYKKFKKEILETEVTYVYDINTMITVAKQNNIIKSKTIYFLENNLVKQSIDSNYRSKDSITVIKSTYIHDLNNLLIEMKSEQKDIFIDSIRFFNSTVEYTYTDGNNTSITFSSDIGNGPFSCSTGFSYNDFTPAFNINNIIQDITGNKSRNLCKSATYGIGCPGGPSYRYTSRKFNYKLNKDNYVEKKEELLYPGGSMHVPPVEQKTITIYEYIR